MSEGIHVTSTDAAKVVTKGWGEERWLVHGHAPFVSKLIRLRARVRTSLQLHREKEEAKLLLEGRAELVFGAGSMQEVLCSAAKAVPADRPSSGRSS